MSCLMEGEAEATKKREKEGKLLIEVVSYRRKEKGTHTLLQAVCPP